MIRSMSESRFNEFVNAIGIKPAEYEFSEGIFSVSCSKTYLNKLLRFWDGYEYAVWDSDDDSITFRAFFKDSWEGHWYKEVK